MPRPRIWGHRGAAGHAPENTLAAFRQALVLGADGFELDVTLTADGVPVVIHDDTVNRTTDGQGRVHTLTLAEIKRLDAGRWFGPAFAGERVPTLQEVFEAFPDPAQRPFINIELKRDLSPTLGLAAQVIELVHRHGWQQHVLLSSFDLSNLCRARDVDAYLPLAVLYALVWQKQRLHHTLPNLRLAAHHPNYHLLHVHEVAWYHARGYRVNTWTVNDETALRRLWQAGVDGLITDYPDRAAKMRATETIKPVDR